MRGCEGPFELINQGFSKELFESPFKYKGSRNIDSLAQIISANVPITVEPFWCDSLSTGRIIGITREDINIDSLELIPTAMFFGSIFSSTWKFLLLYTYGSSPRGKPRADVAPTIFWLMVIK